MNVSDLRTTATLIFKEAVAAADPKRSLRTALKNHPLPNLRDGRIILIAFGKASIALMEEALDHIPAGTQYQAIAVTNYENFQTIEGCEVHASGHPVPDENGAKAAGRVIDILKNASANDFILTLISGGGSALLPAPRKGLTLQDKIDTNQVLLQNGYDITEINMIRQHLSELKGGGLAQMAPDSTIKSFIISDVIGDDLRVIASGPTVSPIASKETAADLIKSRGHWLMLPNAVQTILSNPDDGPPHRSGAEVTNTLICSNRHSLLAMQDALSSFDVQILNFALDGDVAEAADVIARDIQRNLKNGAQAFIWGGETTVTLRGKGKGGRNQELALRVSEKLSNLSGDWVFMSAGTDGRDGPTDAAGGIVDAGTIASLSRNGPSLADFLNQSDSYSALSQSGDLLITGGTGTNVADVQLFLRIPTPAT